MKLLSVLLVIPFLVSCNSYNKTRSWSIYKADNASSSYSPLDQLNTDNIKGLKPAWTFTLNDAFDTSRYGRSECNPIIIDGTMFLTSGRHRVYAIAASTGKEIWSFDPYKEDKRILFTAGDHLFAVNANTGKPVESFGDHGKISMNDGFRGNPAAISVIPTTPGIVYNNLLIMGTEVSELYGAEPGYIQAYDIVTGKRVWTFHTIPLPGEPGYETWPKDAWKYAGGVNDWSGMSLDQKRGLVFLALGSPSYDFYGADRKGQNLYGNCVMALDAQTGNYKWHYQTIHHDLWDYDLPAPPNLVTVVRDGKKTDAVAQVSKVGFVYVLDRETGVSLFPIEERPVPASAIPGEHAWPTQPFPLKPKAFARQLLTENDLADFSPGAHDSLVKKFRSFRYEGLFTPPDTRGTLNVPGTRGGAEWGGAAYDPVTGILYVRSNDSPEIDSLQKISRDDKAGGKPLFVQGKTFYGNYCTGCHGADRNGSEPDYPSLIGIRNRMSKESLLEKIRKGNGKMPAFAAILKGSESAIIAYLFDSTSKKYSASANDLVEIKRNRLSQKDTNGLHQLDTTDTYLDITAYGIFKGPDGNPGIKPPFGTLNAIDLNNGDYVWTIPLGNHAELQKNGAPLTGTVGSPGPIVTAGGLVFIGGTSDKKFRAFEKTTGRLVWEYNLPAMATATACSYYANGKQYVAVSIGGNEKNKAGYVMAFALP
jgi:quinoprotein glucose dehydrogenase